MKIIKITKSGIGIVEKPIPAPGAGEVLIKSIACGVCEGDVFNYKRVMSSGSDEELFLGHEGSGTIAAVGRDVTGWKEGDLVTTSLGGAYGEYFVTPAQWLLKLPQGIDPRWIVGEAVACCAYSAQNARVKPGDKVAVVGCGFMGMLCMTFVKKLSFAGEILTVDPIPWRRELARKYCADGSAAPGDPAIPKDYFDVVIEATGAPSALNAATEMAAQHGRLTIVGFHQSEGGLRTVDMKTWNLKSLEITSGHCRRPLWKKDALEKVLPLIASGGVDLKGLVTLYPFDRAADAFRDTAGRKEGLMKASIIF